VIDREDGFPNHRRDAPIFWTPHPHPVHHELLSIPDIPSYRLLYRSSVPLCRAIRADVWRQLLDIHEAFGLRHQWGGSHSNKTLLCSLGIDTRNIVSSSSRVRRLASTHSAVPAPAVMRANGLLLTAPEISMTLLCYSVVLRHNAFFSFNINSSFNHFLQYIQFVILYC